MVRPTEEDDKINNVINKLKSAEEIQGQKETREQGQLAKDYEDREQNKEGGLGKEI